VVAQVRFESEGWPALTPLRIRMVLHTGEAQERDGDYFGCGGRIFGLGV